MATKPAYGKLVSFKDLFFYDGLLIEPSAGRKSVWMRGKKIPGSQFYLRFKGQLKQLTRNNGFLFKEEYGEKPSAHLNREDQGLYFLVIKDKKIGCYFYIGHAGGVYRKGKSSSHPIKQRLIDHFNKIQRLPTRPKTYAFAREQLSDRSGYFDDRDLSRLESNIEKKLPLPKEMKDIKSQGKFLGNFDSYSELADCFIDFCEKEKSKPSFRDPWTALGCKLRAKGNEKIFDEKFWRENVFISVLKIDQLSAGRLGIKARMPDFIAACEAHAIEVLKAWVSEPSRILNIKEERFELSGSEQRKISRLDFGIPKLIKDLEISQREAFFELLSGEMRREFNKLLEQIERDIESSIIHYFTWTAGADIRFAVKSPKGKAKIFLGVQAQARKKRIKIFCSLSQREAEELDKKYDQVFYDFAEVLTPANLRSSFYADSLKCDQLKKVIEMSESAFRRHESLAK